jgi:alanine dehydrogenase
MKIGCVKEVKNNEYRVGLVPATVDAYISAGHEVYIEKGAGLGSSIRDEDYLASGAKILESAKDVWDKSEMIVKVKEPLSSEYKFMKEGQIIYTYFHFAASEELTRNCIERKITAIAYETVEDEQGGLPLLKPMSEVAGSMAPLMGAYFLMKPHGGIGVLPTGVPGVLPANVVVIGGGSVGQCAAKVAAGMGSKVIIFDNNLNVLTKLRYIMPENVFTHFSSEYTILEALHDADIVIGAVLIPGAKTPKLINRDALTTMKKGAVIVDVAIDQSGCAETSKPTTHDEPIYEVDNVVHYCVANMPGAYSRTSTFALNYATIQHGINLANRGVEACRDDLGLRTGLNLYKGKITYKEVATAFGMEHLYEDPLKLI